MNTILMSDVEKVRLFQSGQLTKIRKKLPETKYIREDTSVFKYYDYATGEPALFKWIDPKGVMETVRAKYIVGNHAYIREPWAYAKSTHQWIENGIVVREDKYMGFQYQSDDLTFFPEEPEYAPEDTSRPDKIVIERIGPWRPAQHMPRELARHYIVVTDVRFERLQDMTEEDAIDEGWPDKGVDEDSPLLRYSEEWDNNLKRGEINFAWCCNPWTEVVTFRRATPFDD